jgi:diguanylate cyclase (GGDEF)-like protein
MANDIMGAMYDPRLVTLSIVIASVSAYVALTLGERITKSRGRFRGLWLVGGASILGTGIWSMHFTGMLAYHLPVPIGYDIPTVVWSLGAAVLASGVALWIVSRPAMGSGAWLLGGLLVGFGIVGMHYTGMAAMRLAARPVWDPALVVASIVVSVFASLAALWLIYKLRDASGRSSAWRRGLAALVMGVAIAGMHYTGMAAATFVPAPEPTPNGDIVSAPALGGGVIVTVTLLVLLLALVVAYVDRRFVAQEAALAAAQSHFRAVVASAPVVLFALDALGVITMAEGRDLARVRCNSSESLGRSFFEEFADIESWVDQAHRALGGDEFTAVGTARGIVLEMRWTPVRASDGATEGVIVVGTDITERRRAEDALVRQAFHDDLTDLPNRAAFNRQLLLVIETAAARGTKLALAVLDLNRFKIVNDSLGHEVGDSLLRLVSARLRGVLRKRDFVARLGGDEFAVIVEDATKSDGDELAKRIVSVLRVPFDVDDHILEVGAAVGYAIYPTHAADATTLLRHADVAMYAAKRSGLGFAQYDVFHDAQTSTRLLMEGGLRKAIAENELVLHYQPTLELATGRVAKVEALVRWAHPTLGLLASDRFIPMAEETGLIIPLTIWVLEAALHQLVEWQEAGIELRVAVNLSARSLRDSGLPEAVENILRQYALDPDRLTLEVTETALVQNMDITRESLRQLSELGVTISVDDFGTGYSSLSYLAQLPVNELKIDKSFVIAMHAESKDASIVRWIVGLGHVLGMRVVAEGVETSAALESIRALGCDVAQGFYISTPIPAPELPLWLADATKWKPATVA